MYILNQKNGNSNSKNQLTPIAMRGAPHFGGMTQQSMLVDNELALMNAHSQLKLSQAQITPNQQILNFNSTSGASMRSVSPNQLAQSQLRMSDNIYNPM